MNVLTVMEIDNEKVFKIFEGFLNAKFEKDSEDQAEPEEPDEVPEHLVLKTYKILNLIYAAEDSILVGMGTLSESVPAFEGTQSDENSILPITFMDVTKYIMEFTEKVDIFSTDLSVTMCSMIKDILKILLSTALSSVKIVVHKEKYPMMNYPDALKDYYIEDEEIEYLVKYAVENSKEIVFSKKNEIFGIISGLIRNAEYCAMNYFRGAKLKMVNSLDDMQNKSVVTWRKIEANNRKISRKDSSVNEAIGGHKKESSQYGDFGDRTEESSENGDLKSSAETEENSKVQLLNKLISDRINDLITDAKAQLDSSQELGSRILEEKTQETCTELERSINKYFNKTAHCMRIILGTSPGILAEANFWLRVSLEMSPEKLDSLMANSVKKAEENPEEGLEDLTLVKNEFLAEIEGELHKFLECVVQTSEDILQRTTSIKRTTENKIQDILQDFFLSQIMKQL